MILTLRSLEMSFATQVLSSGQVLILGMDEFGREKMRFYMPPQNERDSIKEEKLMRMQSLESRKYSDNDFGLNKSETGTFE